MTKLSVSFAGCGYDRTRAIFDGRVQIHGCKTIPIAMSPEGAFHRAVRFQEFDFSELALGLHDSRLFAHAGLISRPIPLDELFLDISEGRKRGSFRT